MTEACPHCGQPIPETRFGVRLSPIKLRIFDVIERGGASGIDADDLFALIYAERGGVGRTALKAHIWQLNDMLIEAEAGVFIEGTRGSGRRYTLKRGRPALWPAPPFGGLPKPISIEETMQRIAERMNELAGGT